MAIHISKKTYSSQSSRVNLAIQLVSVNFGPIVATLFRHLLFKGPTTFLELVSTYGQVNINAINDDGLLIDELINMKDSFVELTGNTQTTNSEDLYGSRKKKFLIKEIQISMILLIKNRFIQWFEDENHVRTYFVDLDQTLSILLFGGIFMDICYDKWSELGAFICREFLSNGQLKYDELVEKIENGFDNNYIGNELSYNISTVFDEMIGSRLIKRLESVEDVVKRVQQEIKEEKEKEEKEKEELMSRKKQKKTKTVEEQLGFDGTKSKRRKKNTVKEDTDDLRSTVATISKKRKTSTRLLDDLDIQSELLEPDPEIMLPLEDLDVYKGNKDKIKDIIWVLNIDQFVRDLRKKRIVEYVIGKYDENSAVIIESILTLTETYQKSRNDYQTKHIQFDAIAGHVSRNYANRVTISTRTLDSLLDSLVRQNLIEKVSPNERGTFKVNMGHIISKIKETNLESVVHKKLGPIATRVFRMLIMKKYMEQKSIADEAMVAASDARKQLYLLMQNGFVEMEEVPKGADRNNPLKTIFLWHVKLENVVEMILENMYDTISKIRSRLEYQQRTILDRVGIGSNAHLFRGLTLSEDQNRMLKELKHVEDLLEISMIRLSNMIILFQYF